VKYGRAPYAESFRSIVDAEVFDGFLRLVRNKIKVMIIPQLQLRTYAESFRSIVGAEVFDGFLHLVRNKIKVMIIAQLQLAIGDFK
jgi:hypothetical protein